MSRKNDSLVQVWLPRTDLATLVKAYQLLNEPIPPTLAGLLRKALSSAINYLSNATRSECHVTSTDLADDIISNAFPSLNLNPSGKGKPSFISNLQTESNQPGPSQAPCDSLDAVVEKLMKGD